MDFQLCLHMLFEFEIFEQEFDRQFYWKTVSKFYRHRPLLTKISVIEISHKIPPMDIKHEN